MKIRYLLLGLMICVAGAGTINSSDGSFGGQNITPFLIFGHVWYGDGSPCSSPVVNITNAGTGAGWCADRVSGCNYYQALLCAADVNVSDVLRWSATDGTVFDTTNRTVDQSDLDSGGIFDFDMILQSIAPRITGYAPESQIHDTGGATRRFNITIDQVVNVAWLINGSPVHTNESVTDASYTHTNVAIGVWNVSARASNANGTDMQEWLWNVTTLPPPKITSFAPSSPVRDTENVTRTFGIKVDQVVDVTWLINGIEVSDEADVNESSYTNTSAALGVWNVTAVVSNQNGTDAQEWIWYVTSPAPAPSSVFVVYGNVSYDNGSACNSPFTVITNLNTSEELISDNRTGEGFYQLVTSSAFANAGDVLRIKAHKDGRPIGNATLTVNQTDIGNGAIKVDINKRHLSDFTVVNVSFDPSEPLLIGDLVTINAMIANHGAAEEMVFVELYDNKSIKIERMLNNHPESPINDTIILPDVKRIRVHFESFDISSMGNITIYNETRLVEELNGTGTGYWTEWCDGSTIKIESWNAGFTVDRYEAVFADECKSLGAGNSTDISGVWNLSDQSMGWTVHGSHNITVRVDPYDRVVESDETNNEKIEVIDVNPSLDFAVTSMHLNTNEPVLGDVVGITANISNYGVRNGTAVVGVFYDNRSIEIKRDIDINIGKESENYVSTDNISLPSGVLGARLHFDHFDIFNSHVDICDNSGRVVERMEVNKNDYWTDCIYTDNITVRIEMTYNPSMSSHRCNFTIDRYEALIAEKPVTLNVTESKVINASWLTGAAYGGAREHNIIVMVDPRNHSVETNETNNTRSKEIFVNGTDLTVTAIEMPCGSSDNPCYMGQNVTVTATIANIGTVDVTNFTVEFRDGACFNCSEENTNRSGVIFNETHIDRLNSGENMTISVIWNPAEINNHTITARIPYDNTDSNETNNELSDCSDVEARYDFSVESVNVDQQTAEKGESVNITATVGCTGHGGGNVSIGFFVNSTDFAGTLGERFTRIGTDYVHLEVNKTETVSMSWDVDVVGGCHLIAAVINPDKELEETNPPGGTKYLPYSTTIRFRGDTGNNVKNCTLHVIPLDLDITDIMLVPAEPNIGDMVNVSATIRNNGSTVANSMVWFYMEKDELISGHDGAGPHPGLWSISQPGDCQMRVHFDYIKISGGEVSASVTDSQDQDPSVYFYVKCEKYGGQDVKTQKIGFTTDFNTECYYMDENYRRWDDIWTDWINGTAIEIRAAATNNIYLLVDKYQVRLGNETVTLYPGESRFYHSTWSASLPLTPGENYTLMANVEDQNESMDTYLGGTDFAITDLSVKPVVWDGDRVWVNATIENLGSMNATDFRVNFTEVYSPEEVGEGAWGKRQNAVDSFELFNTTHIECLDAGNSINISVLWNGSVREIECGGKCWNQTQKRWENCSWYELADNYTIKVEINPLDNENKEVNATNHVEEADVHVDRSRDFNVTNLSFRFVNGTTCDPLKLDLYDDVVMNATVSITNNLNRGGSVNVSFYIDEIEKEHEIGSYTIAFGVGNGTEYAEIDWTVMCSPGEHNIIVVADPEGNIHEIDETNNDVKQTMRLNVPDLVLESLAVHSMNPEKGEMVRINVTIANEGNRDASNVTLCIYDWAERHIGDVSNRSGPGQIEITRENATAMRLYLDLSVEDGGKVCVNDSSGSEIICYHENFHGWTPWVLDNSTTIVITNSAYARVSKVYYLMPSSIIDVSTHDLGVDEKKNITVNWDTSVGGERFIAAIVDPEDRVTEYNESNNMLVEFISVQTADIKVSNLSLWLNGTEIGEDDIIKHGDNVTITTDIANIGVDNAGNFSVRFLIDDILIKVETILGLENGSTIQLITNWSATVGSHVVKVEADYGNEINETNETNNIMAWDWYVCGAELSGNISWVTLGLDDEVLFGPTEPYDEDEVNITVEVRNSGCAPATNFNAALLFDYTSDDEIQKKRGCSWPGGKWENRTYPDAEYIYLNVDAPVFIPGDYCRCMVKDDVIVYDGNDSEVARPWQSCWVRVKGDTANVFITHEGYNVTTEFDIYFYPIYQNETSMLYKEIDVSANSSHNLFSINQNVSVGDFTIMVVIDPDNEVPEDEDYREDNVVYKTMHVKPTRDFTVTNVIAASTDLSDLDTTVITAGVSNIGLRNGTAEVSVVDYEEESRTYKYHFNRSLDQSYLPIAPNATLSGIQFDASGTSKKKLQYYEKLMIIHRPGVDAIKLHFDTITLRAPVAFGTSKGRIEVCNETGARKWYREGPSSTEDSPIILSNPDVTLVPGENAYIYTHNADFNFDGYTTERELHREDVTLNATKTWNESKNITSMWTAYTGDHTISVTLDDDDRITEISESNNDLRHLFYVNASRDPAIVELNITPEHPRDGDDVDISAIIANNGAKDASFTFDLWVNTTRNEGGTDESLPDANLITDLGDRIRYITLLKHVNLTLAPGEYVTVNATWNDISIFGSPIHCIIAIVDPLDEIDEMNESNNEIEKEIIMAYPDLTVGGAYVHGGTGKPVVNIKEIGGISGASDVTVRFESYETVECNEGCGCIRHRGASNMQVYFDHIDARGDYNYVEVGGKRYSGGEFSDEWSPWVEGDSICIKCRGGGTWVDISEYRWGNVSDEQIDYLGSLDSERVEMPWEYEYPRMINVTVDPANNITELDEGNNKVGVFGYADLRADRIRFVSPSSDKLSLDAEKFKIDGYITNDEDGAIFSVRDFNVTLEFRNRYPNGTVGDLVFNMTKHVEEPLCAGKEMPIRFEFDPSEELEVGGNYTVFLIADSSGDICESSELYPDGEDNNATSVDIYVYPTSGYTGGGELINVAEGEVHGGVVFTIGDSKRLSSRISDSILTVNFDDVILDGAEVKFARLYLYVDTGSEPHNMKIARPIEVDMEFNGHKIQTNRRYTDISNGSNWNVTYGLYCYDITDIDIKKENVAVATRISPYDGNYWFGIAAIGLLVVYEDEDELLTKYWINEGIDVMMPDIYTGLSLEDCIVTAEFDDVEREDLDGVNATLMTISSLINRRTLQEGANGEGDVLKFNGHKIGTFKDGSHWIYQCPTGSGTIAMTGNKWESVTDYLKRGNNFATMQSKGNYILPANAFLRLIFPPDLNITNLTAPASTVVGAHHSINATIRNDGRSDAHDFNVTFYIDRKQMIRIPHLDLPAGENMTLHLYNWTPMMLVHVYNLTAAADVLSGEDWTEIETENNAMTKYVTIEEGGFGNQTGPRGTGGGSNPTGGKFTEPITGRIMQGMKDFLLGGGGGGAGMFSLTEWIMKGAVWFVLLLFVGLGYRMEQRSYGRVKVAL